MRRRLDMLNPPLSATDILGLLSLGSSKIRGAKLVTPDLETRDRLVNHNLVLGM